MNSAKNLFDQQYGIRKWKFYDNIIKRLRCIDQDQFNKLLPSDDGSDPPIFACKFSHQNDHQSLVALANEDGKLAIHDTSNRQERHGIQAHNNAIFDLAWMFENMKIVTVSGDHTARLFDVTNSDIREVRTFYGHTRSLKTIAFHKSDPGVFATGGRDGKIILWDSRTNTSSSIGKADRTINSPHSLRITPSRRKKTNVNQLNPSSLAESITGLVFQDDHTLVSCAAGDGVIKIWDLRKNYVASSVPAPKREISYPGSLSTSGYSSLIIDKNCPKLYASCMDNTIYCFNLHSSDLSPVMKYIGHQNSTYYVKSCLSMDGNYLVSGSSDQYAYIWNTQFAKPFIKLSGHNAEVTCVAWSERDITLVTCSDDMSHKIWRVSSEELPENWEVTVKGQAEVLPIFDIQSKLKRGASDTPTVTPKKIIRSCDKCENPLTSEICPKCSVPSKRKYLDEISNDSKRFCGGLGPRSLFRSAANGKRLHEDENEDCEELAKMLDDTLKDLPNYVVDGRAPHLNLSPPKKVKVQDWMTKSNLEGWVKRTIVDSVSEPRPAKVSKVEVTPQNKFMVTKNQSLISNYLYVKKPEGHLTVNKTDKSENNLVLSPSQ